MPIQSSLALPEIEPDITIFGKSHHEFFIGFSCKKPKTVKDYCKHCWSPARDPEKNSKDLYTRHNIIYNQLINYYDTGKMKSLPLFTDKHEYSGDIINDNGTFLFKSETCKDTQINNMYISFRSLQLKNNKAIVAVTDRLQREVDNNKKAKKQSSSRPNSQDRPGSSSRPNSQGRPGSSSDKKTSSSSRPSEKNTSSSSTSQPPSRSRFQTSSSGSSQPSKQTINFLALSGQKHAPSREQKKDHREESRNRRTKDKSEQKTVPSPKALAFNPPKRESTQEDTQGKSTQRERTKSPIPDTEDEWR